jgi:hypothetical protein
MIIEILHEFIINGDTLYVHQELKLTNSFGIHDGKVEFSKFFGN